MNVPTFVPLAETLRLLASHGLIGEINRLVLHPRGLSLHVVTDQQQYPQNTVNGMLVAPNSDLLGFVLTGNELQQLQISLTQSQTDFDRARLMARASTLGGVIQQLPKPPEPKDVTERPQPALYETQEQHEAGEQP